MLPFFALPLWLGVTHYAAVDQSANTSARTGWEAILAEPLPPGAVLVSNDRNDIMPLWYFQYVDGVRPDLLGLFPLITPEYPTLGPVLDLALSTERPVYLIKEMPGIEVKVEVEAEGRLWRVLGPAAAGEPAYPRRRRGWPDAVALVGYDLSPRSPGPARRCRSASTGRRCARWRPSITPSSTCWTPAGRRWPRATGSRAASFIRRPCGGPASGCATSTRLPCPPTPSPASTACWSACTPWPATARWRRWASRLRSGLLDLR